MRINGDIKYAVDPVTGTRVEKLYDDADDQLGTKLSRGSPENLPAARTAEEKTVTDQFVSALKSTKDDPNAPTDYEELPMTGVQAGIALQDLAGADYDDPKWELFLDQFDVDDMTALCSGAFGTKVIPDFRVPETVAKDGTQGFVNSFMLGQAQNYCYYPAAVVFAATWNEDFLYDYGEALGNEGLVNGISGIYAPKLNLHRSPMGGRNGESYSEDPLLSGRLAASMVEGLASKGVYATLKQFALNEQETHRSYYGLCVWLSEQALRELYLKPFEIAIKTAMERGVKAMGVMGSYSRIGTRWTGGDYRLLTQILRDEWGFRGFVVSEYNTNGYMVKKDMHYAGGDFNQTTSFRWSPDKTDVNDMNVLRRCAKNILYVLANSNAVPAKDGGEETPVVPETPDSSSTSDSTLVADSPSISDSTSVADSSSGEKGGCGAAFSAGGFALAAAVFVLAPLALTMRKRKE